jgi:murein DD-endopeptidase MepM/ murein hydrolase activator NlpD
MKFKLTIFSFLLSFQLLAQEKPLPDNYFGPPINIPLFLSGTFGELRRDHIHSGIDIKTQSAEGKAVVAIADGYISRIKVSPTGFGKALYINHPNGYTSVYAHLQKFNDSLQKFTLENQYKKESFALNLFPDKKQFRFKKGDTIAFSGNSGGSFGPHLHFEIRDTKTEKVINPLFFKFDVKDFVRPRINYLKIYSLSQNIGPVASHDKVYQVKGWGLKHHLPKNDTIVTIGNIAFGINVYDQLNDMPNKNGVYSVEMYIDSNLYFKLSMDQFTFPESRYINSLIDYAEFKENKRRFVRTEIDPNNHLSVYDTVQNHGIYIPQDTLTHLVKFIIKDTYANVSELKFYIKNKAQLTELLIQGSPPDPRMFFAHDTENYFDTDSFRIKTPANAFYRDFVFTYSKSPKTKDNPFTVHHIHQESTPVHKWIEIEILPDSLIVGLENKYLIARVEKDKDEQLFISEGGEYFEGKLKTNIRDFGDYLVCIDTIAPEIKALNISKEKNLKGQKNIKFKISDELSGIADYRASLNGDWILMDYDPKNELLIYNFDSKLPKGESKFLLTVTDKKGNLSEYSCKVNY